MKKYIFKIKPLPKARPRVTARGTYMPPAYTKYKEELRIIAKENGYKLDSASLNIYFYFTVPKSCKGKKLSEKERDDLIGEYHKGTPDLDNLIGAFMDAMLDNDSSIASIKASKFYGDEDSIIVCV